MPVSHQASSADIEPFWNRLPSILLYPCQMASMMAIVFVGLSRLLLFAPVIGWLLVLLAIVVMYHYAFACLRESANGNPKPPDAVWEFGGTGWRFIGLIFILGLVVEVCMLLLGPRASIVFAALIGFCLPGATITLAMEDSLVAALNPGKWVAVITRIGWPYLAVVGLCLIVLLSETVAKRFVAGHMGGILAVVSIAIIGNYGLVVAFHLMGYLVYQYHDELGYTPIEPDPVGPLGRPDPDQDLLNDAAELVQAGQLDEARSRLRSHLRGRGGSDEVHRQYRKLLTVKGDKARLLEHGRDYLNVLLAQQKDLQALKLIQECRRLDPKFAPKEEGQVTRLAHLAAKRGRSKLAVSLLSGFHERFPQSKDIVRNYLLAATLMHEQLNQDAKARKLLLGLKANFPDSPLLPQVEQRLQTVEKMMASTGKLAPGH